MATTHRAGEEKPMALSGIKFNPRKNGEIKRNRREGRGVGGGYADVTQNESSVPARGPHQRRLCF